MWGSDDVQKMVKNILERSIRPTRIGREDGGDFLMRTKQLSR
jgi:hypothetical protein